MILNRLVFIVIMLMLVSCDSDDKPIEPQGRPVFVQMRNDFGQFFWGVFYEKGEGESVYILFGEIRYIRRDECVIGSSIHFYEIECDTFNEIIASPYFPELDNPRRVAVVKWRSRITGAEGEGSILTVDDARYAAAVANREFPDIYHWVEVLK